MYRGTTASKTKMYRRGNGSAAMLGNATRFGIHRWSVYSGSRGARSNNYHRTVIGFRGLCRGCAASRTLRRRQPARRPSGTEPPGPGLAVRRTLSEPACTRPSHLDIHSPRRELVVDIARAHNAHRSSAAADRARFHLASAPLRTDPAPARPGNGYGTSALKHSWINLSGKILYGSGIRLH
jgi:hypothetical protein